MKISKLKLDVVMARGCFSTTDIVKASCMPAPTVFKAFSGKNVKPATAGRIAKALGVDVTEIIED